MGRAHSRLAIRSDPAVPFRRFRAAVLAVAAIATMAACESAGPAEPGGDPSDGADGLLRGVALSPAGFPTDYSLLPAFFD